MSAAASLLRDQSGAGGVRRARRAAARGGRSAMDLEVLWRYLPSLVFGFGVTIFCWSSAARSAWRWASRSRARRLRLPPLRWALEPSSRCSAARRSSCSCSCSMTRPFVGLRLGATAAGVLGLALYSSAYFAEIFRAGFAAVPRRPDRGGDQRRHDAVRYARPGRTAGGPDRRRPPIVNMLIVLSKETVVLSIVTVPELMYQMQTMAAETSPPRRVFAMAVFYWILVEAVSRSAPGSRRAPRISRDPGSARVTRR